MAAKIVSTEMRGPIVSPMTIDRTREIVSSLAGHPRIGLQRDEMVALMWWVATTCYTPTVPQVDLQTQCASVSNQPLGGLTPDQRERVLLAYLGMCLPEVYTALQ